MPEEMDADDPRLAEIMSQPGVSLLAPHGGPGVYVVGHAMGIDASIMLPWDQVRDFIGKLMDVQDQYETHMRDAHGI